ncbi:MAG: amino acid ABC transporter permease [Alphaproteobacteria bacterium]|nr:amino acid ABC transporter permease [Alphaproteobacteria bacterium]
MVDVVALPPPEQQTGLVAWVRKRLFSNWTDGLITLVFGAFCLWLLVTIFDWAVLKAVWSVEDKDLCREAGGACWSVIEARGRLILFGLYPFEQHWRSTLACLVIIATMALSCLPWFWTMKRLPSLWLIGFGIFLLLMYGGVLGMPLVTTEQWGGLSLTVFIFCSVAVIGMPLSVILALARRSHMPVVSRTAGAIIDVVRSLPLLTILFTAAVVIPLTVPDWMQGDKLARVVVAFALFFACYQAEIIRAGLQSIPPGQEEAAAALGMKYWHRVFDILLPQAFRNTLPSTINQFVITFKETSIVTIIGFFEIMASSNAAVGTGDWAGQYIEVYVFVGAIYFLFVFGLSRYGAYLERRARLHND